MILGGLSGPGEHMKAGQAGPTKTKAELERMLPLRELRIVGVYVLVASLWIIGSDMAIEWLVRYPIDPAPLQTYKGLNFVVTTGFLLFVVLKRSFDRWRRAELKLLQSEERFSYAARAVTDAIYDFDFAAKTIWWSEEFSRQFGYTPKELELPLQGSSQRLAREDRDRALTRLQEILKWWSQRLHPEDRDRAVARLGEVFSQPGQEWAWEYRFRRKDGQYAVVQDRGFVIRDKTGQVVRMLGGLSDITSRKMAEQKLEQSRRQLQALTAKLESLREQERGRISREIHDKLGQMLTGLKMDLRWVENRLAQKTDPTLNPLLDKIVAASELVDDTIVSVQEISADLRPPLLDNLGLMAAIRHEARRFQERTGIVCQIHGPDSTPALVGEPATTAFRIFQEALTNVARHAQASEVGIDLEVGRERLCLRISDNGRGIRPEARVDPSALGLLGMEERAALLGGEVSIQPGPERGTVVTARIPLADTSKQGWMRRIAERPRGR
jgi:two-component system sensor histidine kinase UhpB